MFVAQMKYVGSVWRGCVIIVHGTWEWESFTGCDL